MSFIRTELSKNLGQIISNRPAIRYWRLCFRYLPALFLICLCVDARAQIKLSEQDITETINYYKALNQLDEAKKLQAKMPTPIKDEKIRKDIMTNLPLTVLKLKVENAELTEKTKKLFEPILRFYNRDKVYEIIIFKYKTPVMLSDTGVVIAISSGMIERAESDDELMGYLAHEIGHEYFAPYSIFSRHLLKLVAENGREPALNRKYLEAIATIEMQCDAFAVITLTAFRYNSLSFVEGFERAGKDFPEYSSGFHPDDEQRRKLVEQITLKENLIIKPRVSTELKELKKIVEKIR